MAETQKKMTVAEFLSWAEAQDRGRFELVDGVVIAMAPERAAHVDAKYSCVTALKAALIKAGADCHAYADGLAVVVDDQTSFEPDATVNCGPRVPPQEMVATNPVVVLEVLSPSTRRIDTSAKLKGYFKVASIMHYLIVDPVARVVVLHQRAQNGKIDTSIHHGGEIVLAPPGISIAISELFG